MPTFLSQWESAKKALDQHAKNEKALQKTSGLTPLLKDVDAALAKKGRKAALQALTKFNVGRQKYTGFLAQQVGPSSTLDPTVQQAVFAHLKAIQTIEHDIAKAIEKLQEEKEPKKAAIEILVLEGDFKSNVARTKKALQPFAAIDKKHEVLKLAAPAAKAMEAYSKAAARTQVREAHDALTSFVTLALKCCGYCNDIAKKETDKGYTKAVQSFSNDLKTFAEGPRVKQQLKALNARLTKA